MIEHRLDIEINLKLLYIYNVAASKQLSDVSSIPLEIDDKTLADYDEFVVNVESLFDYYGFDLIDYNPSSRSNTSRYYTYIRKDQSTEKDIKCIFFARISDHNLDVSEHRGYLANKAEAKKMPKNKNKQKWKFKNIVVNGNTHSSYEEALSEIEEKIKSWK